MNSAVFSLDRRHRYVLRRSGGLLGKGSVLFIMLNPSTADEHRDDPTIRRCMDFAWRWHRNELVVCNLFAWRATDPRELAIVSDPVGQDNDLHIWREAREADDVICAWGNRGGLHGRAEHVLGLLRAEGVAPKSLRMTKAGQPEHPLYLPASLTPQEIAA